MNYTTARQVSGLTLGNGVIESYGDSAARLQLTNQTAIKSGNSLINPAYTYQTSA